MSSKARLSAHSIPLAHCRRRLCHASARVAYSPSASPIRGLTLQRWLSLAPRPAAVFKKRSHTRLSGVRFQRLTSVLEEISWRMAGVMGRTSTRRYDHKNRGSNVHNRVPASGQRRRPYIVWNMDGLPLLLAQCGQSLRTRRWAITSVSADGASSGRLPFAVNVPAFRRWNGV